MEAAGIVKESFLLRRGRPLLLGPALAAGVALFWAVPLSLKLGLGIFTAASAVTAALILRWGGGTRHWLLAFFLAALGVRCLLVLPLFALGPREWVETPGGLVQDGGFVVGDGYVYASNGHWLAERWRQGVYPDNEMLQDASSSKTTSAYDYWNGLVTYWLGFHPLNLLLANALLGAWCGILIYGMGRRFLQEPTARWAGGLTAFWPSSLLWSVQNVKEPMAVFLLLLTLALFLAPRRWRGWSWPGAVGSAWLLNKFSAHFVAPMFNVSLALFLVLAVCAHSRVARWLLLAGALFLALSAGTWAGRGPLQRFARQADQLLLNRPVLERMFEPHGLARMIEYLRRVRMVDARTPFFEEIRLDRIERVALYLPLGFLAVLTLPAPWSARSLSELAGSVEMLAWYPLIPFALWGMARALRWRPGPLLLLLTAVTLICFLALLEGNVGTLFRHRSVVWPLLFFFAAAGVERFLAARETSGVRPPGVR